MQPELNPWYRITNPEVVNSPALLIYPERVQTNVERMLSVVKDKSLIRPHVKTHKMPDLVLLQIRNGIRKFKCATIAEAEMAAVCGPDEILMAYQPTGPNVRRFIELQKKFPSVEISCITDCEKVALELSGQAMDANININVWLDINNGMNRTGIAPGKKAVELFHLINNMPNLKAVGLHVYDGHLHDSDFTVRKHKCDEAFSLAAPMIEELKSHYGSLRIVAGGTPTFPIHAQREGVETSPGTPVLWDYGYSSSFADLNFLHAAVLFTRVVSKPAEGLVCIDLGTKAVASEMPHPRIKILEINDYEFVTHNEEHMVIRSAEAYKMEIGDAIYCIPYHICPTSDRFDKVSVVRNSKVTEEWKVEARRRKITI
jgi:D-serine deaminase-like pyridoxal phosphate-dependent protein